jgi:hypothetical protein
MRSIQSCESGAFSATYRRDAYGPILVVREERTAGLLLVEAGDASAKGRGRRPLDSMRFGFALQWERLRSAGERPALPRNITTRTLWRSDCFAPPMSSERGGTHERRTRCLKP